MSFDEIIYRIDNYPSFEMSVFRSKDCITHMEINEEMKLYNLLKMSNNCKIVKSVRFPEDGNLVSNYFECKNYWQKRKLCSNDELINLYKKSCQFYNIKPNSILLKQIKDWKIVNCKDRQDILDLSNIKLDWKHVESLEEIFKHVQFKELNFENSSLDDDSATSLFEIIEYYQSCLKLDISYNGKMSCLGINALFKLLKRTPCLETVELRGITFSENMINPLNRALKLGSNLKVLHLGNSNISSKNLQILSMALKFNVHLRELYLPDNKMILTDGLLLGSILKVNRLLKTLDIGNNFLGDIGLSHICAGMFHGVSSDHECDDDNYEDGISCLVLCNNSITHNGMHPLSSGLKVCKSLKKLNLGLNPITNEGVHILREGLLANESIFSLSLRNCKITCEGAVSIAEYLAETAVLMRLDIRNNDISIAGLIALSASMKVNTSVVRFDIDSNPKKAYNVPGFFDTQCDALKTIQQRVEENRKASVEQHELELLQNLTNYKNAASDIVEIITDVDPDLTETDDLSSGDPLLCSGSEEVSESSLSHRSNDDSISDNLEITFPPSLDLSSDLESPPSFYNDNFTKVLSPTDKILQLGNKIDDDLDHSDFGTLKEDISTYNNDVKGEHFFDHFETDIPSNEELGTM